MKKKIVLAICLVMLVLSLLCFIWAAYTAENYRQTLQEIKDDAHYINYFNEYTIWYALYICVTIFNLLIICGAVFLFIYFYKNDYKISKEERNLKIQEKKELRKQAKKEKLQKKLNDLNKQ